MSRLSLWRRAVNSCMKIPLLLSTESFCPLLSWLIDKIPGSHKSWPYVHNILQFYIGRQYICSYIHQLFPGMLPPPSSVALHSIDKDQSVLFLILGVSVCNYKCNISPAFNSPKLFRSSRLRNVSGSDEFHCNSNVH